MFDDLSRRTRERFAKFQGETGERGEGDAPVPEHKS
jgi:hypothetical protein